MTLPEVNADDPQFLHALLCQLGLPRKPTEARVFERRSGAAGMVLEAGRAFNGTQFIPQPLPSGTRPRLVLIHVCSEAVRTKQRQIDVGHSARDFLRQLRIDEGGRNMKAFRAQMLALSVCRMTLGWLGGDGKVSQVECPPVDKFDAWLVDDGGQKALWPGVIELSERFAETLREHAVPLAPEAIARLQHRALALDAYTWLAHRLCRVRQNDGVFISWQNLRDQFGQEYGGKYGLKEFQREFSSALLEAHGAYPEGDFDVVVGGVRLFPSPPPVKKTMAVVKLPRALEAAEHLPEYKLLDGRAEWADCGDRLKELHIDYKAYEDLTLAAPGWDRNVIVNCYYVMLGRRRSTAGRNPTLAFEGWVRRRYRGKRPG